MCVFCVCQVSLEFLPSSAVPGEETTMQLMAEPDSLCGVSAVDQSVLIMRPGKGLTADKVTATLQIDADILEFYSSTPLQNLFHH